MAIKRTAPQKTTITIAWITTLLLSALPNIIWNEFFGPPTIWLFWSKIILLGLLILVSHFLEPARSLRYYFVFILVLFLIERVTLIIGETTWWQAVFHRGADFTPSMFDSQIRKLIVALVMTLAMFVVYKRPSRFFLVPGNLRAPVGKEGFLFNEGYSWTRVGLLSALFITLGTLTFLWLAGRPELSELAKAVPFLPAVLLLAAMNAFSEELSYRAALLAPLINAVGRTHSVLLTATFFGVAHFYGVPYGIIGVFMSFALGYFLSKSMLETKGFFWPFFIHFWQDVAIFSFMAVGAIMAGGG